MRYRELVNEYIETQREGFISVKTLEERLNGMLKLIKIEEEKLKSVKCYIIEELDVIEDYWIETN